MSRNLLKEKNASLIGAKWKIMDYGTWHQSGRSGVQIPTGAEKSASQGQKNLLVKTLS